MKKGFTLVEVLICVSIFAILSICATISVSNYKRLANETDTMISEDAIIAIINNGKQYCREKEEPGYVLFDTAINEVKFISLGKVIDSYPFPKGIGIYSINTNQNRVDINKFGITSDAGTILLRDGAGGLHEITINVGAGYAEIK